MAIRYENVFVQKNHGLPGLGIPGNQGNRGEKGKGVYFGEIGDFFDTIQVVIDAYARIARKNPEPGRSLSYYTGLRGINNISGLEEDVDPSNTSNYRNIEFILVTSINGYENEYNFAYDPSSGLMISPAHAYVDMRHIPYEYTDTFGFGPDDPLNLEYQKGVNVWHAELNFNTGQWNIVSGTGKWIDGFYTAEQYYVKSLSGQDYDLEAIAEFDKHFNEETWEAAKINEPDGFISDERNQGEIFQRANKVKVSEDPINLLVPTNLKKDFIPGDILYIFEYDDMMNPIIRYMVNVTEDMIGMNISYVLDRVSSVNPFHRTKFIEYGYNDVSRILTTGKLGISRLEIDTLGTGLDTSSYSVLFTYKRNFNKSSVSNDYVFNISEFNADQKSYFFESDYFDTRENVPRLNQFSISYCQSYKVFNNSSTDAIYWWSRYIDPLEDGIQLSGGRKLRFSTLYVNNQTISNLPLNDVITPPEVYFDNNDFIRPLQENDINFDTLECSIDKGEFFDDNNDLDSYFVGSIIVEPESGRTIEFETDDNLINFLIPINPATPEDASGSFYVTYDIYTYLRKTNTTKYHSRPTRVEMEIDASSLQVLNYQVEESYYDYSDNIDSEGSDSIIFNLDPISPEESVDEINLRIDTINSSTVIDHIYFNGEEIEGGFSRSWINITQVEDSSISKAYQISVSDNLPNVKEGHDEENPTTIEEYLRLYSGHALGNQSSDIFTYIKENSLPSTKSRKIDCNVMYHTYGDKSVHMAHYEISQPGFQDPRVIPSIYFTPYTSQEELEKSNNIKKGVLANQFQYFVGVNSSNLNIDTWFKYFDDLLVDIEIEPGHFNVESIESGLTSNVHLSDFQYLVESRHLEGTWLKERIGITEASIDSSIRYIEEDLDKLLDSSEGFYIDIDSSLMPYISYEEGMENPLRDFSNNDRLFKFQELETLGSWSSMSTTSNQESTLWMYTEYEYQGLYYNDRIILRNLSYEDFERDLKIRDFLEFSNPFNAIYQRNFVVSKITLHSESLGITFEYYPFILENANLYGQYSKIYEMSSGNCKFIFNPISLKGCPKEAEGSLYSIRNVEVKITGPKDLIKVGSKLYGIEALDRLRADGLVSGGSTTDIDASSLSSVQPTRVSTGNYVKKIFDASLASKLRSFSIDLRDNINLRQSDASTSNDSYLIESRIRWNENIPQIAWLQDNIKAITISPLDPIEIKSIVNENSDYSYISNVNDYQISNYKAWLSGTGNLEGMSSCPFYVFEDDKKNYFQERSAFMIGYDSSMMRPRVRDGISSFYYNDELLETSKYSQHQNNFPVFSYVSLDVQCRDTSLIESMETWNFEYENTTYFNSDLTSGGILSKSGNGYQFIQSSADHGQYEEEGYLTLQETINRNNVQLPIEYNIDMPGFEEDSDEWPDNDKLIRGFLWQSSWQFPLYQEDNRIFPLLLVDAEDIRQDKIFIETLNKINYSDLEEEVDLSGFDELTENFISKRSKYDIVPYSWVYSIYPRVLMKTDKSSAVILMLRKPSIYDDWSEFLPKRYFNTETTLFEFYPPYVYEE